MKYHAVKLGLGLYEYRGYEIRKEEDRPGHPWVFTFNGHLESFEKRALAMRQLDRHLATMQEIARAPSDSQLEHTDLCDYCTPDNLIVIQRHMYSAGSLATRESIIAHAGPGGDGVVKRLLVAAIAAPWYLLGAPMEV